jgi:hypothetical protein
MQLSEILNADFKNMLHISPQMSIGIQEQVLRVAAQRFRSICLMQLLEIISCRFIQIGDILALIEGFLSGFCTQMQPTYCSEAIA